MEIGGKNTIFATSKLKKMSQRVLMAMSGGIDSSVAALLLQEQGYDLQGITFYTQGEPDRAVEEAQVLADKLGIPHHVLNVSDCFRKTVMQDFIDEYMQARTPNPCVVCNPTIKFGILLEQMRALQCDYLATGHYAQIAHDGERYFVRKGVDTLKDQSYFLWRLPQEALKKALFPLGGMTKAQVRQFAADHGFVKLSEQKESEDICFLPDNDYRAFLRKQIPDISKLQPSGNFVDTHGKILGKHNGLYNYTIGQRKGLGIALGVPAYVVRLDVEHNQVVVGTKEDLQGDRLQIRSTNWMKISDFEDGQQVSCRIRYRSSHVPAQLFHTPEGAEVRFANPVESITPGQSAVFYDGDDLLGGGIII